MKIEKVIRLAGLMERGNVLPEELAIEFLSEFDGMIQSDIMLHAPEEIVRYDSKDQELLLRPPHDGLYVSFLVAMIRQCQGEYEGYNNAQEIVEDKLKTFRRWYIHHYRPADTGSRSYTGGTSAGGFGFAYLSAYGLAVKHGYQGSEEEWLQSLKGEKGDDGAAARMRYDAQRDMIQWGVGEEWHDLYTMAQVLAPLYAKLDEMTARAETAAGDAEAAADAAQTAKDQAVNILHAAEGHAREALNQANKAAAEAEKANRAYLEAENMASHAEDAREVAEKAAQEAKEAAASGRLPGFGEDAEGQLLFVSSGTVTPLKLGPGLRIENGVLYVSGGAGEPEEPLGVITTELVDGDFRVYLDGVEIAPVVDSAGDLTWPGLELRVDDSGNGTLVKKEEGTT